MFCTNCGSENPDYGKVCVNCGAPLESLNGGDAANGAAQAAPPNYPPDQAYQPVNTPGSVPFSEKMNTAVKSVSGAFSEAAGDVRMGDFKSLLGNKKFLICGGAVLALIIIIIIIVAAASSSSGSGARAEFAPPQNDIRAFVTDDDETVFFYNGKRLKTVLDGDAVFAARNLDGSVAYAYSEDGELYAVTSVDAKLIANEYSVILAADYGANAYYVSDDVLYFYNGNKSEEITESDEGFTQITLSPNGSSCAWTEYDEDGDIVGRAYVKGKIYELGKANHIFSITDSGDVIFYRNDNGKLCYMKDLRESESVKSANYALALSADRRKILFADSNSGSERTYMFDSSMSEAVKVCNGYLHLVMPQSNKVNYSDFNNFVAFDGKGVSRFVRNGDEYEKFSIVSDCDAAVISDDGRFVLYMKNNKVYKKSALSEDADRLTVSKGAGTVVADGGFNNIYYIDDDNALCYSDGRSEDIVTVYDKDDVYDIVSTALGVCVFIYDYSGGEGSLAYSVKGGGRQKCGGLSSACLIFTDSAGKYVYAVDDDDNLYVSTDGKNFTDTKTVYSHLVYEY